MSRKNKSKKSENIPKEYVCVRVYLVHVKKGIFGYRDNILSVRSVIPNTVEDSIEILRKIDNIMKQYGIEVKLK